jgi:glycosyltransferase involved in cell wall biosynthesis
MMKAMMAPKTEINSFSKKYILMVGPNYDGRGGVASVISTWFKANFFEGFIFNYVSSKGERFKLISLNKGLITYIFYLTQSPDIIYIHCSAFKSFYRKSLFILLANLFRHKIIIHIHSTIFYDFYSGLAGLPKLYATFILKRVYTFIVLTEEMRDLLSAIFPEKPIYVLRNPIDVLIQL